MKSKSSSIALSFGKVSCLTILLTLSAPTMATKDANKESEDIVVIGQQTKVEQLQNLITNQFKISGGGKQTGQYARFAAPICPSVGGFSDKQKLEIENRIREVALLAELPIAAKKCRPNLFVAVVADGVEEIAMLRKKRGGVFSSLTHSQRDKMVLSGGPVYSWKSSQRMASDSGTDARAGSYSVVGDDGNLGVMSFGGQRSHVKSKIKKTTFTGISYSYLLIESRALTGVSPTQLADYASVASLIDIDVNFDTAPPASSILSLFSDLVDDQSKPQNLSNGDLLMLRGLYKVPANVKASLQRSAMLHAIEQSLASDEKAD